MGQGKMKIQHDGLEYEGIPSSNAIGMALFESIGMRRLIDERCKYDKTKRNLSPGMVVKALIGPTFNITKKYPLYLLNTAYNSAPTDRLFGEKVEKDDLYDNALGRGLDALFDADLEKLFVECSNLAVKKYGFVSNIAHMDATDISFWGIEKLPDKLGAAIPMHNGHAKDGHNELLQYELQVVTDSNGIIRYMRPYSGNVADSVMDSNTLDDFNRIFSEEERKDMIIVGDSKLATSKNIMKMMSMKFKFISKCSEKFIDKAKSKVIEMSLNEKSEYKDGLYVSSFDHDVEMNGEKKQFHFVVYRYEEKVLRKFKSLLFDSKTESESFSKSFIGIRYGSEEDALSDFYDKLKEENRFCFKVKTVFYKSANINEPDWWEIKLEPVLLEDNIFKLAEEEESRVIVTNLNSFIEDPTKRPFDYLYKTDLEILNIYNQEYKVEHSFRFMKSGMGMNSIFLQTPSRENAMMFVISIAVLICNIADALFKRKEIQLNNKQLTMYNLAYYLQTTLVTYSRSENTLRLQGPNEVTSRFFKITDSLELNPQYLFGILE